MTTSAKYERNQVLVSGFVRLHTKKCSVSLLIPQAIVRICLLFFHIPIDSCILSMAEEGILYSMVANATKNQLNLKSKKRNVTLSMDWKLLFRGSRDDYTAKTFHDKCGDTPDVLCIIESVAGNVFGGYTKAGWKSKNLNSEEERYSYDANAFLYLIRSTKAEYKPAVFGVTDPTKVAVEHYNGLSYLARFGRASCPLLVCENGNDTLGSWAGWSSTDNFNVPTPVTPYYLNADVQNFRVKDMEVYQVIA